MTETLSLVSVGVKRIGIPEGYGLIVNGTDVGRVAEIEPSVWVGIYKVADAPAEGTEAATTVGQSSENM